MPADRIWDADPELRDEADAEREKHSAAEQTQANRHDPQYRFTLIDASEITLNKRSAYLVKNIIPAQGLIVVWGPPKCGKSFWVLDIAFHVALGWEYRGHRVKQGLAIYIGCEGEFAVPARVEAFRQARIGGPIDPEKFKLILSRLDLIGDVERLIADIEAQLGGRLPVILFIDTLNRSLAGSESSDEDMGNYVKAADRLRERFHCAVVIIHHCGYTAEHPRGHTSLAGATDAQIAVTKNAEGLISTIVEFMKDGPDGGETASRFQVVDNLDLDEEGEPISSCVLEESDPPGPKQTTKPKGTKPVTYAAKVALDTLKKAVSVAGSAPPASNHIPTSARVVEVETWRRHHYAGTAIDGQTPEARKKEFQRVRQQLQAAGAIGLHNDLCWVVADV